MEYTGHNDYTMKVFLDINENVYVYKLMCQVKDKACGLVITLLSMCAVKGLYMCTALVDLVLGCV